MPIHAELTGTTMPTPWLLQTLNRMVSSTIDNESTGLGRIWQLRGFPQDPDKKPPAYSNRGLSKAALRVW